MNDNFNDAKVGDEVVYYSQSFGPEGSAYVLTRITRVTKSQVVVRLRKDGMELKFWRKNGHLVGSFDRYLDTRILHPAPELVAKVAAWRLYLYQQHAKRKIKRALPHLTQHQLGRILNIIDEDGAG